MKGFPLPFRSLRTIRGAGDRHFLVGAMFTAAYADQAERLAASCRRFALPFVLHEVPAVHRSISARGTDDLAYTKANFIRHLLASHRMPILYLDVDCEFLEAPALIDELVAGGCDFAIYNWFADEGPTDCFLAVDLSPGPGEPPVAGRFYRFLVRESFCSTTQLKCNGLVQFYANSLGARALLARWHRTIATFPASTDDGSLTFTFNNVTRRSWLSWRLKVRWLPGSYARVSWWIFTKPIINHPGLPSRSTSFREIVDLRGRKRIYPSLLRARESVSGFHEGSIIDTERHMICELVDGRPVPIGRLDQPLWL